MIKNIKEVKECPECGSMRIIHNQRLQQVICKDCGMIYEPMEEADEEQFERASEVMKKKKK